MIGFMAELGAAIISGSANIDAADAIDWDKKRLIDAEYERHRQRVLDSHSDKPGTQLTAETAQFIRDTLP